MRRTASILALAAAVASSHGVSAPDYDVFVYGATPAGIQAALAAANEGLTVLLATPAALVGGMMTGGLGATDVGTPSAIGGAAIEFFASVCAAYHTPVPADRGCWHFEPHVALSLFEDLLSASPRVSVQLNATLQSLSLGAAGGVESASLVPTAQAEAALSLAALSAIAGDVVSARIFIDATCVRMLLLPRVARARAPRLSACARAAAHANTPTRSHPRSLAPLLARTPRASRSHLIVYNRAATRATSSRRLG